MFSSFSHTRYLLAASKKTVAAAVRADSARTRNEILKRSLATTACVSKAGFQRAAAQQILQRSLRLAVVNKHNSKAIATNSVAIADRLQQLQRAQLAATAARRKKLAIRRKMQTLERQYGKSMASVASWMDDNIANLAAKAAEELNSNQGRTASAFGGTPVPNSDQSQKAETPQYVGCTDLLVLPQMQTALMPWAEEYIYVHMDDAPNQCAAAVATEPAKVAVEEEGALVAIAEATPIGGIDNSFSERSAAVSVAHTTVAAPTPHTPKENEATTRAWPASAKSLKSRRGGASQNRGGLYDAFYFQLCGDNLF